MKFDIHKIQVSLNLTRIMGTLHEDQYSFLLISPFLIRAIVDSRQRVVLQIRIWARCKQILILKPGLVTKYIHVPWACSDPLVHEILYVECKEPVCVRVTYYNSQIIGEL